MLAIHGYMLAILAIHAIVIHAIAIHAIAIHAIAIYAIESRPMSASLTSLR